MHSVDMEAALIVAYRQLQADADDWFRKISQKFPQDVLCHAGCSSCCYTLFDISIPDARVLEIGLATLEPTTREACRDKADTFLSKQAALMPLPETGVFDETTPPHSWPDLDGIPCPLLDDHGRCRLYHHRPLICRMHGLPLVDLEGAVLAETGCHLNFSDSDPAQLDGLRWDLQQFFIGETALVRQYVEWCCGEGSIDLHTTIAHVVAGRFDFPRGIASV